jgi:HAD superfamily hydrolase (TIGR01490 family)
MKRPLAVFDVDGTIFRSSLTIELAEKLIEEGVFPRSARAVYTDAKEKWLDRQGDYEAYVTKVVEAFNKHLKGVPYGAVANAAGEVIEAKKDRVYRYPRDLIKNLKQRGFYLLAVSHSYKLIVDGFCYELGFDKTYGTLLELGPNDAFTGKEKDFHIIANKGAIVKRLLEKEDVTLDGSVGIGDTESDISFLEMVERPIAFNPNQRLLTYAKRMAWEVVVERKDVIYAPLVERGVAPEKRRPMDTGSKNDS